MADGVEEVLPALRRIQQAVDGGLYAAGFIAYEAAPAFDSNMAVPPRSELPLVWFGLYRAPALIVPGVVLEPEEPPYEVGGWMCGVSEQSFRADIDEIREGIGAGDFYQVNYTLRQRASFRGDAYAWYCRLSLAQRAAFSACLDLGRFQILSVSPELFFQITPTEFSGNRTRRILARPMKGTHPRGRWPDEDDAFREILRLSEKDRAENLMIVDLVRNDLGRIAATGSVHVEALFEVERYPTLLQMTSTISAQLRDDVDLPEILAALFPCGSVTGAPKIAAMRKICELEREPRQVYCGTIGILEPSGKAVFNVAIRTVVIDREKGNAEYGVGSGVTWDSRAEAEYAENLLKASVLSAPATAPDLFETLRLQDGNYSRCERHLDRILASADYFDISVNREALLRALREQSEERPAGVWRVRLQLSSRGEVRTECELLEDAPDRPRTFALASEPVDRMDRFLFHKVRDRSGYIRRKSERPDVYDVLLQNREGELTEFTTGNVVLGIDGERVTPPLDCGLLPGVLRAELLEAGVLRERPIVPADLERAKQVWLVNSLRGWVPMSRAEVQMCGAVS